MRRVSAAVLLGLTAVLAWRNVVDVDVGLHLAGGRYLALHGAVPGLDPFTWTLGDRAYVAYHWAFQLALHAADQWAGVRGLVTLRFALVLAAAGLLLAVLRLRAVGALAGALTALLALLSVEWRFTLRPELASWLLAAAQLLVLERHRRGARAPLWLLPCLQIVWANTHVHAFGLALIGIYALDECLRRRTLRVGLLAWGGVAALASLVNPYGVTGALYPLLLWTRVSGASVFGDHIAELTSPLAIAPDTAGPFASGVQLSAYRTLFLLGAIACASHLRARRFADAAVLGVFGGLSLMAVRNLGIFAVVSLPAIAAAVDGWLGGMAAEPAGVRRRLRDALLALSLGFALLCIPRVLSGSYYAQDRRPDRFEASLCRECLGLETADWLARQDLAGRGLNDLRLGSVLVWRDPAHPVFIDGRNEVTGEDFYARYLRALDPARWPETQAAFDLEYVALLHRGDPRAVALSRRLREEPDWRLVHLDGAGVVFVRASGPNGSLPAAALPDPVAGEERRRRLAAVAPRAGRLDRARRWLWSREPPPGAAHGLGNYLARLGENAAAERPLLEAVERSPNFFEPYLDLGLVYRDLGLRAAAVRCLRDAAKLAPDHPELAPLVRWEAERSGAAPAPVRTASSWSRSRRPRP
jgi:tetratricopeptide (TPR) repeat protein